MDLIRHIVRFLRDTAVASLSTVITPILVTFRLKAAELPTGQIVLIAAVTAVVAGAIVFSFRRWVYDRVKGPITEAQDTVALGRLRVLGLILVIVYFAAIGSALFLVLSSRDASALEQEAASKVLNACVLDPVSRGSEDAQSLLQAVIAKVNATAPVRTQLPSGDEVLDYLGLDLAWLGDLTIRRYDYRGRALEQGRDAISMRMMHWSDSPIWKLKRHMLVLDGSNGDTLQFDIARHPVRMGGNLAQRGGCYMVGVTLDSLSFNLIEEIEWPCGLWSNPDGLVFDYSRFADAVALTDVNIITMDGTVCVSVYRLKVDDHKEVISMELDSYECGPSGELPLQADAYPVLYRRGARYCRTIRLKKVSDLLVFVIWPKETGGDGEGSERQGADGSGGKSPGSATSVLEEGKHAGERI